MALYEIYAGPFIAEYTFDYLAAIHLYHKVQAEQKALDRCGRYVYVCIDGVQSWGDTPELRARIERENVAREDARQSAIRQTVYEKYLLRTQETEDAHPHQAGVARDIIKKMDTGASIEDLQDWAYTYYDTPHLLTDEQCEYKRFYYDLNGLGD